MEKTTTKELINEVLSKKFNVSATIGNFNNHIGVPLTLLKMSPDIDIGIIEMGANHIGEIAELCEIAQPDHGLITNIGKAHIEGFGSFEGVKRAKNELYNYMFRNGSKVFVNGNNPILMDLVKNRPVTTYGTSEESFCMGKCLGADPFLKLEFYDKKSNISFIIGSKLIGAYNFENALAAICVGLYFGVETEDIKDAVENYFPTNNRSQVLQTNSNTLLLDAYNANPTSMEAALNNFEQMQVDNKVLILGDMLELGEVSDIEHDNIVRLVKEKSFKKVFFVGRAFMNVQGNNFPTYENTEQLIEFLENTKITSSYILLKGSRGVCLEKAVDAL